MAPATRNGCPLRSAALRFGSAHPQHARVAMTCPMGTVGTASVDNCCGHRRSPGLLRARGGSPPGRAQPPEAEAAEAQWGGRAGRRQRLAARNILVLPLSPYVSLFLPRSPAPFALPSALARQRQAAPARPLLRTRQGGLRRIASTLSPRKRLCASAFVLPFCNTDSDSGHDAVLPTSDRSKWVFRPFVWPGDSWLSPYPRALRWKWAAAARQADGRQGWQAPRESKPPRAPRGSAAAMMTVLQESPLFSAAQHHHVVGGRRRGGGSLS